MSTETKIHIISDKFTFDEDTSLKVFLRESTESHVEINAQNLRKIDSLLLQYLIAASRKWRDKGLEFCVTQVSSDLGKFMPLLGIDGATLNWKVVA